MHGHSLIHCEGEEKRGRDLTVELCVRKHWDRKLGRAGFKLESLFQEHKDIGKFCFRHWWSMSRNYCGNRKRGKLATVESENLNIKVEAPLIALPAQILYLLYKY